MLHLFPRLFKCTPTFSIYKIHTQITYVIFGFFDVFQVSSIGQSISDGKRFTVFTGTKSLHLRAATSEDRASWIEALKAVKETFPRMSNEELMASTTNVSVSTDKLRQRLMEEEVDETIIKDCEDIMKNNFLALHDEVMSLKRYQYHLIDSLKNVSNSPIRPSNQSFS